MSGSCASYIEGIANHLRELGINDPAVADLHGALAKTSRQAGRTTVIPSRKRHGRIWARSALRFGATFEGGATPARLPP